MEKVSNLLAMVCVCVCVEKERERDSSYTLCNFIGCTPPKKHLLNK